MRITNVEIKLPDHKRDNSLRAFATITFDDCFVVRELKIIESKGRQFVSMPDRKLKDHCPECDHKNELLASFCGRCGAKLDQYRGDGHLHADVAHPITQECRAMIETAVLAAYRERVAA